MSQHQFLIPGRRGSYLVVLWECLSLYEEKRKEEKARRNKEGEKEGTQTIREGRRKEKK